MRKLALALGLLAAVAAGALWTRARRQQVSLPGVPGALGVLPARSPETRSIAEIQADVKSPDAATRREALRFLGRAESHGRFGAAEALPYMEQGVSDADASVRAVATAYLARIRVDSGRVVPRLASLLKDPHALVRMNAASGLNSKTEAAREALPSIIESLNDDDPDTRHHLASALLYFKEVRYTPPPAWAALSREDAMAQARRMGLSPNGPALFDAVSKSDMAGVYVLLKAGVDPNVRGEHAPITPLFFTVGSRPEITRFLLEAGADVHLKDGLGRTVLSASEASPGPFAEENRGLLRAAGGR